MDKYIFTHFIVKKKIKKSFSQYLPKRKKNPSPCYQMGFERWFERVERYQQTG